MNTFEILPAQPNQEGGWTVEYRFLKIVTKSALVDHSEVVSLEQAEAVLLSAFSVLGEYFPNGLRAR